MYLPVSRLFWVSSLAYPNLLGTKGYVVVVVVVVFKSNSFNQTCITKHKDFGKILTKVTLINISSTHEKVKYI
jgi:hypothetical protein